MDELDHLGWVVQQSYEIGQFLVGVRTNSEPFAAWLDDALAEYRTSEKAAPYYSILVAEGEDRTPGKRFHIIYRESMALTRSFDLGAVVRTLLAELEALLFHSRDDAIYADAALVGTDGVTGLVLPSLTIPYVGTLGRRVQRDLRLPVAGQVAIDPDSGRAVPVQSQLAVSPRSLEHLAKLAPTDGGDDRIVVERPLEVDAVCFVALAEEPVRPVSRGFAVFQFAGQVVNLAKMGEAAVEGLGRLAERARCYEIQTKTPQSTFDALLAALRSA